MSAQELVNEAGSKVTLQWENLVSQLQTEERISEDEARRKIAKAFVEWRRSKPDTVMMRVLRAIAAGKPIPKDLSFTDQD